MKKELLRTEESIKKWLKNYEIESYELIEDSIYGFVVNVYENVHLKCKDIGFVPVKFNKIDGHLDLASNQLTNLTFCPNEVTGDVSFFNNNLTDLAGFPHTVGGDIDISYNHLLSLIGCPRIVEGHFSCGSNKLVSLEGGPEEVYGEYHCDNNKLKDFIFCPKEVDAGFYCYNNKHLGKLQKEEDFAKIYRHHLKDKLAFELSVKEDNKAIRSKI